MSDSLLAIVKNGKIELIDTLNIPEGTPVLVTPIPSEMRETLALQELERAYSDDEPEYTLDLIKEFNPDFRDTP